MSAALYFPESALFVLVVPNGQLAVLLKGIALSLAAASAHHVTLTSVSVLFALPVWAGIGTTHAKAINPESPSSDALLSSPPLQGSALESCSCRTGSRSFAIPSSSLPIPHASRSNLLMSWLYGMNISSSPMGLCFWHCPSW